jgi:hypothetical protein
VRGGGAARPGVARGALLAVAVIAEERVRRDALGVGGGDERQVLGARHGEIQAGAEAVDELQPRHERELGERPEVAARGLMHERRHVESGDRLVHQIAQRFA